MTGDPVRRHHISAVAEHFFAKQSEVEASRSGDMPPTRRIDLVVAAPSEGQLAAMTAAVLVRSAVLHVMDPRAAVPRQRVVLEEYHRQPWSAAGFWSGSHRTHLASCFRPLKSPEESATLCAMRPGGDHRERTPPIAVINLGCPQNARHRPEPLVAPAALFWCLSADEPDFLRSVHRLGWLAACLQPARIEALLFPAVCTLAAAFAPGRLPFGEALSAEAREPYGDRLRQSVRPIDLDLCPVAWPGGVTTVDGGWNLAHVLQARVAAILAQANANWDRQ